MITIALLHIFQQMPQTSEPSLLKSGWDWLEFNSGVIGILLSLFGILLSLLGFYVLILQTRKIRTAAQAGAAATEQALTAISATDTISDLSGIRERMKKVQIAVRSSRYETSLMETQSLRESLHQLRSRRGFATDESRIEIQEMVTFLRKIQTHFEKSLSDELYPVPGPAINQKLSDLSVKMSEWIENARFNSGGDKNDSNSG